MSLWQLYEEAALYHGVPDIDYMIPDIRNLSEEDLHKTCDLLAAYADQVAKTSAVICVLLGSLLGISTIQYNKQEKQPPDEKTEE